MVCFDFDGDSSLLNWARWQFLALLSITGDFLFLQKDFSIDDDNSNNYDDYHIDED